MRGGNEQGRANGFPTPQREAPTPEGAPPAHTQAAPPSAPNQHSGGVPPSAPRGGFPGPQRQPVAPNEAYTAPPTRHPQSAPQPPTQPPTQGLQAPTLESDDLFEHISRKRKKVVRPGSGIRGALYNITNGRVNLGLSQTERQIADLIEEVQVPIYGDVKHIVVWSQKGGVGKTTTTTRVGVTLARHRTDRILALDVNPDGGSLAVRVPRTTERNILNLRDALRSGYVSPTDFDKFVNHAPHRLDSIVMTPGKKPTNPLTGNDFLMIAMALQERYSYKFIVTDCGTNLSDSVMDGVLAKADQLVVVTPTTLDEATVTAGGLEALANEGYGPLVRNAVTAIIEKSPRDPDVAVQRQINETSQLIRDHFERLTRTVVSLPYDSRIFLGDVFDPEAISLESQIAELELTKEIVHGLAAGPR